ncbi:MAG: Fe-S-containing protein [Bifidobacteriaceae bacterium]|nr:Fe-S-containing protein [Bifidobacteriaceae bacterium]
MDYLVTALEVALAPALVLAGILVLIKYDHQRRSKLIWFAAGGTAILVALTTAILRQQTRFINWEIIRLVALPLLLLSALALIVSLFFHHLRHPESRTNSYDSANNTTPTEPTTSHLSLNKDGHAGQPLQRVSQFSLIVFSAGLIYLTSYEIWTILLNILSRSTNLMNTDTLLDILGWLTGLFIASITALAFYQASRKLPDNLPNLIIGLTIGILTIDYLSELIQLLMARGILSTNGWWFDLFLPIFNHSQYFIYAVLLAALVVPIVIWWKNHKPALTGVNPAENRKLFAQARSLRRWSVLAIIGSVVAVGSLTGIKAYSEQSLALSPPELMKIVGDLIVIPTEDVDDGHLHRFAYTASDGTEVRFIIVQKNSGSFGIGLDACEICGDTGYYERGDDIICKLCDVVMNKNTIGFKGGCNPIPLAFNLSAGEITIQTSDLENEKHRFGGSSTSQMHSDGTSSPDDSTASSCDNCGHDHTSTADMGGHSGTASTAAESPSDDDSHASQPSSHANSSSRISNSYFLIPNQIDSAQIDSRAESSALIEGLS